MNPKSTYIKPIVVTTFPYGFNDIFNFFQELINGRVLNRSIRIDLSRLETFDNVSIVVLSALIVRISELDVKIEVYYPYDSEIRDEFNRIGFKEFCVGDFLEYSKLVEKSGYFTPIIELKSENLFDYVNEIVKKMKRWNVGKDVSFVQLCIPEIVDNIYDHAESKVFCFCQYDSNLNIFKFTAYDMGIGIIEKVKSCSEITFDNSFEVMKWAITLGNTTNSKSHNAGKGLENIITTVNYGKGNLDIYTNDVLLELKDENLVIKTNPILNHIGTLIDFSIESKHLESLELFLVDLDF